MGLVYQQPCEGRVRQSKQGRGRHACRVLPQALRVATHAHSPTLLRLEILSHPTQGEDSKPTRSGCVVTTVLQWLEHISGRLEVLTLFLEPVFLELLHCESSSSPGLSEL